MLESKDEPRRPRARRQAALLVGAVSRLHQQFQDAERPVRQPLAEDEPWFLGKLSTRSSIHFAASYHLTSTTGGSLERRIRFTLPRPEREQMFRDFRLACPVGPDRPEIPKHRTSAPQGKKSEPAFAFAAAGKRVKGIKGKGLCPAAHYAQESCKPTKQRDNR